MKVADLTPEELRILIGDVVEEKLKELLVDPDYGLELKDEIEVRLKASLASKERISFEEVKKRIGLD